MVQNQSGMGAPRSKTVKYVFWFLAAAGAIFMTVGMIFVASERAFTQRSEAAVLTVTQVERKEDENGTMYRPSFETQRDDGTMLAYTGTIWMSPKPHDVGDVTEGRVDWDAGEMRSASMMKIKSRLGMVFAILGAIMMGVVVLASIAINRRR